MRTVPGGVFGTWNAFHCFLKIDEMNSYLNNPLDSRQLRAFIMLAREGSFNMHVRVLSGVNNHHIAEAIFKALARALRAALTPDARLGDDIPSTKGTIG